MKKKKKFQKLESYSPSEQIHNFTCKKLTDIDRNHYFIQIYIFNKDTENYSIYTKIQEIINL